MSYIDFLSVVHKSTTRDYLARVNDSEFPKNKAADLAKKWDFDYWDGDRRINYGGYKYMEGRWEKVAKLMIDHYGLKAGDKILDIGCGKGFLLYEMQLVIRIFLHRSIQIHCFFDFLINVIYHFRYILFHIIYLKIIINLEFLL